MKEQEIIIKQSDFGNKSCAKIPLVRCRDCTKRMNAEECPIIRLQAMLSNLNNFSIYAPNDNWFCADGVLRDLDGSYYSMSRSL